MIDTVRAEIEASGRGNNFQKYILENARKFEECLHCDRVVVDDDGERWIFCNQLDYLAGDSGNIMVNIVGRYEKLAQDFGYIA